MSFDLLLFKSEEAPRSRSAFIEWYETIVKDMDEYPKENMTMDKDLLNCFNELTKSYPQKGENITDDTINDDEVDALTDYCIGQNYVHCSFSKSKSDEANIIVKNLARKHHVGFYGISAHQEIMYNCSEATLKFTLTTNGIKMSDDVVDEDVIDTIDNLKADDFLIIEPSNNVGNYRFLQAKKLSDDLYDVETRIEDGDGFLQYQVKYRKNEVIKIFTDFLKKIVPDISYWKDISDIIYMEQRFLN